VWQSLTKVLGMLDCDVCGGTTPVLDSVKGISQFKV
jgi:hypothetical protein